MKGGAISFLGKRELELQAWQGLGGIVYDLVLHSVGVLGY